MISHTYAVNEPSAAVLVIRTLLEIVFKIIPNFSSFKVCVSAWRIVRMINVKPKNFVQLTSPSLRNGNSALNISLDIYLFEIIAFGRDKIKTKPS